MIVWKSASMNEYLIELTSDTDPFKTRQATEKCENENTFGNQITSGLTRSAQDINESEIIFNIGYKKT